MEAQAVATRLMIELCGARARRRARSTSAAPGPQPATIRLRDARVTALLGVDDPARALRARSCRRSASRPSSAEDGLDVTVPDFRRADITREADLIEEVARLDGAREAAGDAAGAPRRRRPADAAPAAAPARRATRSPAQGLHEIVGWSFAGPELADAAAARPTPRRRSTLANPMSSEQSQLRTTLLGSLLDVAARNRARGADSAARCSRPARCTCRREPRRRLAERAPPRRRAADRAGASADLARAATRRRPTSSPPRACSQALLDALGVDWERRRAASTSRSCTRAARRAIVVAGEPSAGSARSIRRSPRSGTSTTPSPAFELDLDADRPSRADRAVPATLSELPRGARGPRGRRRRDASARPRCSRVVRSAGGAAARRRRGVRRLPRPERLGAGNVSLAVRADLPAPDRTLTDEEVAERRERDRRRARRRAGREDPCLRLASSVFGAAGFTGALAARLLYRHPTFELRAVTARSDVGRRLDELYPHHRVPLVLEELDLDRHADVDAAVVAYPHGAAAPLVAELRARGRPGRRPQRRLPPARRRRVRGVVPRAPGAGADRRGRLRAARALPRADPRRRRWSPTPAAIRRRRSSRSRRWRAPG